MSTTGGAIGFDGRVVAECGIGRTWRYP